MKALTLAGASSVLATAGWWIIGLLLAAVLGLSLRVMYQSKDVKIAEQARDAAQTEAKQAQQVNSENRLEVARIKGINEGLMDTIRADQARAQAAGARIATLELERAAVLAQRSAERRKLGRENPEVASYQSSVMPLPLFCSLWPESGDCKN